MTSNQVTRLRVLAAGSALVAGLICAGASNAAEPYPSRSLRIIVPQTAGGPTDVLARVLGHQLTQFFNVPVIVDNRPGGGSNIGFEAAARSAGDGYTLLVVPPAFAVNVSLYAKLGYDPLRDFAAVSQIASSPLLLVVHPSIPAHTAKDLVALANAQPGKMNFASAGNGTTTHLAAELFKMVARVDLVHVPYKGSAPAITDLLAGRVEVTFTTPPAVMEHVRAGKVKALAITSAKRSPYFPSLPTIAESGFAEMGTVTSWYGLVAPAATPRSIVQQVNLATMKALSTLAMRESLNDLGLDPVGSTPEQCEAFIKDEVTRWSKVVKTSGAKAD